MSKATYVKDGGLLKEVKNVWIKENGVLRQQAIPKGLVGGSIKEFISYFTNLIGLWHGNNYNSNSITLYNEDLQIIKEVNLNDKHPSFSSISAGTIETNSGNLFYSSFNSPVLYLYAYDENLNIIKFKSYSASYGNYAVYKFTPINTEPLCFIVTMGMYHSYYGWYYQYLFKVDENFQKIWSVSKNRCQNLYSTHTVDENGNIFWRWNSDASGTFISKYDKDGNHINTVNITTATSNSNCNIECYNGNIITGYHSSMYKYDNDLNLIWEKSAGTSHPKGIKIKSNGDIFYSGIYKMTQGGQLTKLSTRELSSITIDYKDNLYGTSDTSLMKFNSSGNLISAVSANGATKSICAYPGIYEQYKKDFKK